MGKISGLILAISNTNLLPNRFKTLFDKTRQKKSGEEGYFFFLKNIWEDNIKDLIKK